MSVTAKHLTIDSTEVETQYAQRSKYASNVNVGTSSSGYLTTVASNAAGDQKLNVTPISLNGTTITGNLNGTAERAVHDTNGASITSTYLSKADASSMYVANMLHLGAYDTYTYDSSKLEYTINHYSVFGVLDGSEGNWNYDSTSKWFYRFLTLTDCINDYDKVNVIGDYSGNYSRNELSNNLNLNGISNDSYTVIVRNTDFTDTTSFTNWLKSNPIHYDYHSSTLIYTETRPNNSYARTSQPYIEEWKKSEADRSANLCESFSVHAWSALITAKLKPNTTYTCVCDDEYQLPNLYIQQDTTTIQTLWSDDYSHYTDKFTFTTNSSVNGECVVYCGINQSSPSITKIMLSEGSAPLPYQPYEGEVVHGKGLAETLSAYPTSQSVSETYLSKADASSTYVQKSDGTILTGTFTTDANGAPTFNPSNIDPTKILAANDGDMTCFYSSGDCVITRMTDAEGSFQVGSDITNGVCYYIG